MALLLAHAIKLHHNNEMTHALDVYIGFDSAWTDKASAPGGLYNRHGQHRLARVS